jgi:hypothetical protein
MSAEAAVAFVTKNIGIENLLEGSVTIGAVFLVAF